MNKWKLAFLILVPILLVGNIYFGYHLIDTAISYSYLSDSYNQKVRANEQLAGLIILGGKDYSQSDFLHLLRQAYPEGFIVEEGNRISVGDNSFLFESGHLIHAQ